MFFNIVSGHFLRILKLSGKTVKLNDNSDFVIPDLSGLSSYKKVIKSASCFVYESVVNFIKQLKNTVMNDKKNPFYRLVSSLQYLIEVIAKPVEMNQNVVEKLVEIIQVLQIFSFEEIPHLSRLMINLLYFLKLNQTIENFSTCFMSIYKLELFIQKHFKIDLAQFNHNVYKNLEVLKS